MNKHIDQLLQQRMDRKNFLKHVVMSVVMMSSVASLIKTLHQPSSPSASSGGGQQQGGESGLAYGGAAYGGVKANGSH